jgi:CheY-like chemotaxis protein
MKNVILYIDDDADDVQLLHDALLHINGDYALEKAADGQEGLELLHRMKSNGRLPCLVVLDLNMPRMDGRQTFQHIRSDEQLAGIPIVIFSTSNSQLDQIYFQGKNVEYITKPINFPHLIDAASRMLEYCRTV